MTFVMAIGAMGSMVGASDPASFITRVEQSQGITPRGAQTENAAVSPTESSYSQPASFIARVEQSQGITPSGVQTESAAVSNAPTQSSYSEPASFIARVDQSQRVMPIAVLEGEDQLSPEQIRLVQRTLTDKGYPTPVNGKFDERTRSSLMSFQRSQSLPASGTLDSRTVGALGFAPSQVTPVRGPRDNP